MTCREDSTEEIWRSSDGYVRIEAHFEEEGGAWVELTFEDEGEGITEQGILTGSELVEELQGVSGTSHQELFSLVVRNYRGTDGEKIVVSEAQTIYLVAEAARALYHRFLH